MPRKIAETGIPLGEAEQGASGLRYRARLITPGWGSSGHYGAPMLAESVQSGVWRDGLKVYLDHPGAYEEHDRPERSLRDLTGKISGATMESDGVYATLTVLPHMRELVESLATDGDLDMSIRAFAEARPGEAEGRKGVIIDRITEALSVDLVTEAGAGGRVMELIESARKAPGHEVAEATANDRADQLRSALAQAYATSDEDWIWLRDWDDARGLAWFEQNDTTYQQSYTATDDAVTLTGSPVEVTVHTTYTPVEAPTDPPAAPAGQTQPEETTMPQIEEARLRELTEAETRVPTLEAERDTAIKERDEAREALAQRDAETRAAATEAAISAADLPDVAKDRLREAMRRDPEADVAEAIKTEAQYLAAIQPHRPEGFGATTATESAKPSRSPWGRDLTKEA